MKFSIITVCYNSEQTICKTILSVKSQVGIDFEHIIVDGNSKDKTINIIQENIYAKIKFISEPDFGLYDAMNKGIRLSTGDIVGILNSDDFFASNTILLSVAKKFKKDFDVIFGNVEFINNKNLTSRKIALKSFKPWYLKFGWMPPHPATFFRKTAIQNIGYYNISYKTAADYEYFIRSFLKKKLRYLYLDLTLVIMKEGGLTTRGIRSYYRTSIEMNKAIKANGFFSNILLIFIRLPIKWFYEKKIFFK